MEVRVTGGSSYRQCTVFAFKEFCMEKRLSNIFKTTNVTTLTKAILKISYRVPQKFPYLISCIIFEEKYFSGYILLADQISLSDCLYILKYWETCVLQLFVSHVVTS